MRHLRQVAGALAALSLAGSAAACGQEPAVSSASDAQLRARQERRLQGLRARRQARERLVGQVTDQRRRALAELARIDRVQGHSKQTIERSRYGSDGTGDPDPWVQSGPHATPAPNMNRQTIAQFERVVASGRIRLVGAARTDEIPRGLIDDRLLRLLIAVSGRHRLELSSFRLSHPTSVQDDLGTPTESNHVFGRAADISSVDGVACRDETRGKPYRTLLDNPAPVQAGPCLALADEIALTAGELAPGEVIFYWRVPGPSGVSLPNHDDHVHIGYRNYPNATGSQGSPPRASSSSSAATGSAEQEGGQDPDPTTPDAEQPTPAGKDTARDLQVPDPGPSTTLDPGR